MIDSLIILFYENPIGQLMWLVASLVFSLSIFFRDDKVMLYIFTTSLLIWALHYYLLDLTAAAAIHVFMVVRNIFMFVYPKNKLIFYIALISPFIVLYFSYQSWASILTIIPPFIFIYGVYYLKGIPLRLAFMSTGIFWLIYGILWSSIMWVVNEVMYIVSWAIAIYKIKK